MVIETELAEQAKQTNRMERAFSYEHKQCAVTEHQFCLSISDKLSIKETMTSVIPIIKSRTYSGSPKVAHYFSWY